MIHDIGQGEILCDILIERLQIDSSQIPLHQLFQNADFIVHHNTFNRHKRNAAHLGIQRSDNQLHLIPVEDGITVPVFHQLLIIIRDDFQIDFAWQGALQQLTDFFRCPKAGGTDGKDGRFLFSAFQIVCGKLMVLLHQLQNFLHSFSLHDVVADLQCHSGRYIVDQRNIIIGHRLDSCIDFLQTTHIHQKNQFVYGSLALQIIICQLRHLIDGDIDFHVDTVKHILPQHTVRCIRNTACGGVAMA